MALVGLACARFENPTFANYYTPPDNASQRTIKLVQSYLESRSRLIEIAAGDHDLINMGDREDDIPSGSVLDNALGDNELPDSDPTVEFTTILSEGDNKDIFGEASVFTARVPDDYSSIYLEEQSGPVEERKVKNIRGLTELLDFANREEASLTIERSKMTIQKSTDLAKNTFSREEESDSLRLNQLQLHDDDDDVYQFETADDDTTEYPVQSILEKYMINPQEMTNTRNPVSLSSIEAKLIMLVVKIDCIQNDQVKMNKSLESIYHRVENIEEKMKRKENKEGEHAIKKMAKFSNTIQADMDDMKRRQQIMEVTLNTIRGDTKHIVESISQVDSYDSRSEGEDEDNPSDEGTLSDPDQREEDFVTQAQIHSEPDNKKYPGRIAM
ncbi:hypothetical protein FQR65_LT19956 [Abscondita terminalis]|nr:hypothetical protein FQR65_LT19956 [Abscondita terminalis]